jgi:hypothetical protein
MGLEGKIFVDNKILGGRNKNVGAEGGGDLTAFTCFPEVMSQDPNAYKICSQEHTPFCMNSPDIRHRIQGSHARRPDLQNTQPSCPCWRLTLCGNRLRTSRYFTF